MEVMVKRIKEAFDRLQPVFSRKVFGADDNKFGSWSKYFARASGNSDFCLKACQVGCVNRSEDED